jgi:threonine/homoserine/homoserine lactone efflux protein
MLSFDLSVFLKIFQPVFCVVIAVGPCLLTYGNISMLYGLKKGIIGALGCFTIDVLYFILGIFAVSSVVSFLPKYFVYTFSFCAGCFLLYIAYGFWKTKKEDLQGQTIKNNSLIIYTKLVCLTLTNPIAIIGYASIFAGVKNAKDNVFSIFIGATSGSFIAHLIVIVCFAILGKIGKKIGYKVLLTINKLSAIVISVYSIKILFSVLKEIIYKI